jgi:hypothetical protein
MLMGDGHGKFTKLPYCHSGLSIQEDVRSSIDIEIKGKKHYIIGANAAPLRLFRWNGHAKPDAY